MLTEDKVGARYAFLNIRAFMDPNDEKDMKAAILSTICTSSDPFLLSRVEDQTCY